MTHLKICMIGAYAVGKTSLVDRYVRSLYSEKYHTTIGVKIDKKVVSVNSTDVTCMIWDLAGEDEFDTVNLNYLRGMSGYLLVMDGTRRVSFDIAHKIQERIKLVFPDIPFLLIVNKSDLSSEWSLNNDDDRNDSSWLVDYVQTSAKTGENVEDVFHNLVKKCLQSSKPE